ncbi:rhodanese-like domain-containing protein [Ferruginibacter lapsinanis]|uniref:rhodanese-like domain-containing protein n=1 Tax=Ferruginibacter lapsinanis TaxID=563172 RepID=UPI001E33A7B7|nr:rhodanese-like domain-containing protein [Ferruginibacter lapsinanis]UEG50122.1 rhodanese-like domain-containing protein [Ferruginibacter lapsinanis]
MSLENKTIIDVRSTDEFNYGHLPGSINIPLQEIQHRLEELKAMKQPLILCCASGMRSAQATLFLQSVGVSCENGGSWMNLN